MQIPHTFLDIFQPLNSFFYFKILPFGPWDFKYSTKLQNIFHQKKLSNVVFFQQKQLQIEHVWLLFDNLHKSANLFSSSYIIRLRFSGFFLFVQHFSEKMLYSKAQKASNKSSLFAHNHIKCPWWNICSDTFLLEFTQHSDLIIDKMLIINSFASYNLGCNFLLEWFFFWMVILNPGINELEKFSDCLNLPSPFPLSILVLFKVGKQTQVLQPQFGWLDGRASDGEAKLLIINHWLR